MGQLDPTRRISFDFQAGLLEPPAATPLVDLLGRLNRLALGFDEVDADELLAELDETLAITFQQNREAILNPSARKVACMDHGVVGNAINLAGAGIYLAFNIGLSQDKHGWEAVVAGIPGTAALLKRQGITLISSHDGCGAARFIFNKLPEHEQEHFGSPDALMQVYMAQMGELSGIPTDHDGWDQMVRTPDSPPPRLLLYLGTGFFNADHLLPRAVALRVNRGFLSALEPFLAQETGKGMLDMGCRVALDISRKSPKPLLSERAPLAIVPIGGRLKDLRHLHAEAHEVAARYEGSVRVLRGFNLHTYQVRPLTLGVPGRFHLSGFPRHSLFPPCVRS